MSVGTLQLHRYNGIEAFPIEKAEIEHHKNEGAGFVVTLSGEAGTPPLKTLPDTEAMHARPNFEFTLVLPKIPQFGLKVGSSFRIPRGKDETDDFLTRLYYAEHEHVEDVTIAISEKSGDRFRIAITGTTVDMSHYDGSRPPARLEIEAEFTLRP